MEFDALRAAVVPGSAVVGRWPGIVCVAECADRKVLRHLLEVCAAAAGSEPGRALARRLTAWLGGEDAPGDGLRFGTVAVTTGESRSAALRGDQWAVFLYGPVGLVVPDRQVALSGAQAVAWTDRLLPRPDVPVVLALEGGPIPPGVIDGVHDLRSGVVPGAGAVLVPGGGDSLTAGAEEAVRRRSDDKPWAESPERERSRWSGTPEPALAAPGDGLFHSGDTSSNGSGHGARDDWRDGLVPDLHDGIDADMRGELGADRTRLGDRGRAHLRPVPSNGSSHRGRASRRPLTYDLGRLGIGQARSRDAMGPDDEAELGSGGEQDESGPSGDPAADDRSAFHQTNTDTGVNGKASVGSTVGIPGAETGHLNGTGVFDGASNGTGGHSVGASAGSNGSSLTSESGPWAGADRDWFSKPEEGGGTETELGAVAPLEVRRPRHGRQEEGVEQEGGEESASGTPRFGVPHALPPAAALVPAPAPTPVTATTQISAPVPAQASAPAPAPEVEQTGALRAEPVLGVATGEPPRPPLEPGLLAGSAVVAADPQANLADSQVRGHLCQRGHLNDPRLALCAFCGVRIEEAGAQLVAGPRPVLGLLVFDDGTTYTVDAEYLVGRMPEGDARVAAGALRSLSVEDPSGAVSRVHAEVRVTGWDVLLADAGSRNGTFVSGPGEADWTQLPAGHTHRLVPGTRVRLGGRSFLFESPSGAR